MLKKKCNIQFGNIIINGVKEMVAQGETQKEIAKSEERPRKNDIVAAQR